MYVRLWSDCLPTVALRQAVGTRRVVLASDSKWESCAIPSGQRKRRRDWHRVFVPELTVGALKAWWGLWLPPLRWTFGERGIWEASGLWDASVCRARWNSELCSEVTVRPTDVEMTTCDQEGLVTTCFSGLTNSLLNAEGEDGLGIVWVPLDLVEQV